MSDMNRMVECPKCSHKFSLELKCTRCSHTWLPRGDVLPKVCPFCKSPYWNNPRKAKHKNNKKETIK